MKFQKLKTFWKHNKYQVFYLSGFPLFFLTAAYLGSLLGSTTGKRYEKKMLPNSKSFIKVETKIHSTEDIWNYHFQIEIIIFKFW